ncbi:hypothetical protein [Cohnella zeiphila]|uniref:DUF3995 domain-containing protein n=1 Tax=Cohnella zeiphila TaxID=2761120 RepID=A0A7X0SPU6_9BACL|nr:hypothetical protein [Cohnella zeiphila]MBB6733955.1 hypothetical protein [Cohnella zeiphila]
MIRFASAKWGYAASIALLPYAILKTLWANGFAVLATSAGIRELHASMMANGDPVSRFLYLYGVDPTALLALIASLLALALVRNWGRRLPLWLLLLPAGLGGLGFLFVCLVTSYRLLAGDIRMSDSPEFSPWVLLPVYGGFLAWGVTICMAALSYGIRRSLAARA